jgi:hypothetical protein
MVYNLLKLPGPEIRTQVLQKIRNVAQQVDKVNMRYFDVKLASRITSWNIYAFEGLPDLESLGSDDPSTWTPHLPIEPPSPFSRYSQMAHGTFDLLGQERSATVKHTELLTGPEVVDHEWLIRSRMMSKPAPFVRTRASKYGPNSTIPY